MHRFRSRWGRQKLLENKKKIFSFPASLRLFGENFSHLIIYKNFSFRLDVVCRCTIFRISKSFTLIWLTSSCMRYFSLHSKKNIIIYVYFFDTITKLLKSIRHRSECTAIILMMLICSQMNFLRMRKKFCVLFWINFPYFINSSTITVNDPPHQYLSIKCYCSHCYRIIFLFFFLPDPHHSWQQAARSNKLSPLRNISSSSFVRHHFFFGNFLISKSLTFEQQLSF